jgi:predicted RNA binding protein YcfA (HicA-like mRNA interferase family)
MNPQLRALTARDFVNALQADGFRWTRSRGSHRVYRHPDGRRVIVAYHRPSGTFPPKTLGSMIASNGWTSGPSRLA